MIEAQRLNSLFSTMCKIKWSNNERYRAGIMGLLQECATKAELEVAEHVLTNLKYCRSDDMENAAAGAVTAIVTSWQLDPSDTIVVGLAESGRTCGSSAYVRAIQNKLPKNWESSINTTFVSAFRRADDFKNLVIVDDFVGTGTKIAERLERLFSNPKTTKYNIHVAIFAGMDEGLTRIADLIDNRIDVHIALAKCIQSVVPTERAKILAGDMSELEKKIFTKPGIYSMGYEQSESAFYLEAANIPNNNFPILWWEKYEDGTERPTLFSRR